MNDNGEETSSLSLPAGEERLPLIGVALLRVLSFTAVLSTVGMFLCGIAICFDIRRRRTTKGTSPAPFLVGVLGGAFWLRYGFLKEDWSIVAVNSIGLSLQLIYLAYYYHFTQGTRRIRAAILIVVGCTAAMVVYVRFQGVNHPMEVQNRLGTMCLILNILGFAAPLAGLRDVVREQSSDALPLPLCIGNLLLSTQWFFYGVLVRDFYIKFPNIVGISLALVQLSLFVVYPRKRVVY